MGGTFHLSLTLSSKEREHIVSHLSLPLSFRRENLWSYPVGEGWKGCNTVRLRRLSVETERGKTRERAKRGEINLKSCLLPHFPHFPHSLIPLSFQAYPNSIGKGWGDLEGSSVQEFCLCSPAFITEQFKLRGKTYHPVTA